MLDLETIVRQCRTQPAQHDKNRASNPPHPPPTDPRRNADSRYPEKQRHGSHGKFPGAEYGHGQAFKNQPAERRALSQPKEARKTRHGPVTDIERDHFLIEPQREPGTPLTDVNGYSGDGYREW